MNRIIDGRATGKTSRLMLLAKENNGIIVCRDPEALKRKAYAYGIVGIDFITYSHYLTLIKLGQNTIGDQPIYIDELEIFLKTLDRNFQGYTLSEEN